MRTHEATIHRVDAELAAGRPVTPLSDEVSFASLGHFRDVTWPAGFEWIPDWAQTTLVAAIEIAPPTGENPRLLGISRWSGTRPGDGQALECLAHGDQKVGIIGNPEAITHLEALIAEGHN